MKLNFILPDDGLSIKNTVSILLLFFLVGCGTNEKQTKSPLPTSLASISSTASTPSTVVIKPENTASPSITDPYQDAISKALGAATITQSAQSQADWNLVVGMWQEAINLMEIVPNNSSNYPSAKNKINEYQNNLKFAQQMALKPVSSQETKIAVQESIPKSIPSQETTVTTQESIPKPTSQPAVYKTSSNPTINVFKQVSTTKPSTQTEESTPEASVRKFMERYFDDVVNKGYDGTGAWCASKYDLASSLYSPESWKILRIFVYGTNASVTARIESSTKGGMPIRQNWDFSLEKGDTYLEKQLLKDGSKTAYQDSKNKNHGWCVDILSKI